MGDHNAEITVKRMQALRAEKFVSAQSYDDAVAKLDASRSQLALAQARHEQALRNLAYTKLDASCDGRVAHFSLQPGNAVRAGDPLFAIVCDRAFRVDANFKETQLARIGRANRWT